MGIFTKKDDSKIQSGELPKLPELPKLKSPTLPELPQNHKSDIPEMADLPEINEDNGIREHATQLPTFPTGKTGNTFSQNSIKNAVTGREEELPPITGPSDDYKVVHEPIEVEPEMERRIIPRNEQPIQTRQTPVVQTRTQIDEPIFVRIDKFEDSLKIFEKIKHKIHEIENLLKETKEIKEKEKEELDSWQEEIQKLKTQIEKVDSDIFSKVK